MRVNPLTNKMICSHMCMMMACLLMAFCMSSCGSDGSDTKDESSEMNVVIDNNGNASGGHSFTRIDDKNFYIDDIKYTVVDSALEVSGYDETFFKGEANIISSLNYHGTLLYVRSIGEEAFYTCDALTTVSIPQTVTVIKEYAFRNCKQLKSVTIKGERLNTIDHGAFLDCVSLTSFTIPNGVTSVGSMSFGRCSSLASVIVGKNVETIYVNTFEGCTNLNSIKVDSGNTEFDSRHNCNAIIETNTNNLFYGCKNTTIPNSVTALGDNSFSGCTGLTSITIPNSVTTLGSSAFSGCEGLTEVNIPDKVTSIAYRLFEDCTSLTSVIIPNSVTTIEGYAFVGCSSLASVTIGKNVESINYTAFYGCSSLDTLTINSNTFVSKNYRANYEYPINCLPKIFGDNVSNYIIGDEVTAIGEWAFSTSTGLQHIEISNSVKTIGKDAFNSCTGLKSVTLPNNVTSLDELTFYMCTSLTSITIPNSVITIGSKVFMGCSSLTSATIPNSVTSIGLDAFVGCKILADIYCYAENVPIADNAFTTPNNTTLHVPSGSIEKYKAVSPWKDFKDIVALTDSDPRP